MPATFFVLVMFFACAPACLCQSQDTSGVATDSLVTKIADGLYAIGNVTVDLNTHRIIAPGWINMDRGVVEYFAVARGGKTHESVLVLNVRPLNLQVALLLVGLEFGQNLAYQGDSAAPSGDSITASVTWVSDAGDTIIHPASDLVYDYVNKQPMTDNWWVFTGSFIYDNRLAADMEGSIMATYSDPVAILNSPSWARADDTVYGVNEDITPPPGTEVELILHIPE